MTTKIDQQITGYSVVDNQEPEPEAGTPQETTTGPLTRPAVVAGRTYKLRRPGDAIYLTINRDPNGQPIEVFANSRSMDQAHVAVTRLASSMLRAQVDPTVVVEELRAIKDPEGGYFIPGGGGYVPSTMAHIGKALEQELLADNDTDPASAPEPEPKLRTDQPAGSQCPECREYAVVLEGGCEKCTACGESKCG